MQQPKKLRTMLTIGHLHQWGLGYSCRSQIASIVAAKRAKSYGFLPAAKRFQRLGC
jgi:hypothetical protein